MDADIKELVSTMSELIEMSEKRIDKTNEMISYAFQLLDKITCEYTKQVEKLQTVRDKVIEQNGELLAQIKSMRIENELINKRYDSLLERMILMANKNGSENNINVN